MRIAPPRLEALCRLAELLAAVDIVGANIGDPRSTIVLPIDVRIDGDDLDALLGELAKLICNTGIPRVGDRNPHPGDIRHALVGTQLVDLSLVGKIIRINNDPQPRLGDLEVRGRFLGANLGSIPEGRGSIGQDDDSLLGASAGGLSRLGRGS